jgi:hypothetical protein
VAGAWLGCPLPMEGIKSTSLLFPPGTLPAEEKAFALFCGEDSNGCHLEVYPRPNGEVGTSADCGRESRGMTGVAKRLSTLPARALVRVWGQGSFASPLMGIGII